MTKEQILQEFQLINLRIAENKEEQEKYKDINLVENYEIRTEEYQTQKKKLSDLIRKEMLLVKRKNELEILLKLNL